MSWKKLISSTPMKGGKKFTLPENCTQWMNDKYVVTRTEMSSVDEDKSPMIHLSIRRDDRGTEFPWRDLQRIKNQLAGEEYEAVEIFPAESRKIDTANQRHLWCFPFHLGFGFAGGRMVTNSDVSEKVEPGCKQSDNDEIDGPLNSESEMRAWLQKHQ